MILYQLGPQHQANAEVACVSVHMRSTAGQEMKVGISKGPFIAHGTGPSLHVERSA